MNKINNQSEINKDINEEKRLNKKLKDDFLKNLDDKAKMKIWIRTLLYTFRIITKIINTIDKVIIERASNYSFMANIFNVTKKLENQIDIVIDMSERKQKLLNIYVMTKQIFELLPDEYLNIATKKFYEDMNNEEIAEELNISIRSVFRKVNDLIEYVYNRLIKNNWSLKFIELQVKGEDWLIERYNTYLNEYVRNSVKIKK